MGFILLFLFYDLGGCCVNGTAWFLSHRHQGESKFCLQDFSVKLTLS